jgi:hypothetical protein
MTMKHFDTLRKSPQFSHLLFEATYLAVKYWDLSSVLLFQLNNKYLELYFDREGKEIIDYQFFTDTAGLDPYLEEIDISDVLK